MPPIPRDKVVSGAYGVGKVRIVYKPKRKVRINKIGFAVYSIFFFLIYISYAWTIPSLRERHVFPLCRTFSKYLDLLKILFFSKFPLVFHGFSNSFHGENRGNISLIQGRDMGEVMYQQGQKHAIDRLYQMDIYRHISMGTLSSIMGEQTMAIDKFTRALNFIGLAHEDFENMDTIERFNLESYAEGVNSVLAEETYHGHSLDFMLSSAWWWGLLFEDSRYQFKPWEPVHSLAIARLLHYQWNHDWEDELLTHLLEFKFGPEKARTFLPPLFDTQENLSQFAKYLPSLGGNIIAVAKNLSTTDSAFLVHDLHSLNENFGFWYANELVSPSLSVSGLSFPGVPYVLIGRNHFIAWAFVPSLSTDSEDLYLIKNESKRTINLEYSSRVEAIEIYGKAEKYILEFEDTVLGPNILPFITEPLVGGLILANQSKALLSSASLQRNFSLSFYHGLNTASSREDIEASLRLQKHASFHIVVALADGDIGQFETSREIPRLPSVNYRMPIKIESQEMLGEILEMRLDKKNYFQLHGNYDSKLLIAGDALSSGSLLKLYDTNCESPFENCGNGIASSERKFSEKDMENMLLNSYSASGEQYAKLVNRGFALNTMHQTVDGSSNAEEFPSPKSKDLPYDLVVESFNNEFIRKSLAEVSNGVYPLNSVGGTIIEGFRTAFINSFTRDAGPIGSILLGMRSAGIYRSTRLQAFKAVSPNYFLERSNAWLLEKHEGLDGLVISALGETLRWIDFNFDTKTFHKLIATNGSLADLSPDWRWGSTHSITWNHPVVEISPFLDVVWSLGPQPIPGTLDSVFRSTFGSDIGLGGRESLESKNSVVSAVRLSVNMNSGNGFTTLALPTSPSIRPALNFFHNTKLADFISPAIREAQLNFGECIVRKTRTDIINQINDGLEGSLREL